MQGNLNSSQVKVIKKIILLWNVVVVGGVTIVLLYQISSTLKKFLVLKSMR